MIPEPAATPTPGSAAGVDDGALLALAEPRAPGRALAWASRRAVLAAGRHGTGGTIELTEGTRTWRLGEGAPTARVTVRDPRAYGAFVRSASIGLGTSFVAGWWDAEDLTTVVQVLLLRSEPLRRRLDHLGRAVGPLLDLPARLGAPGPADDRRNVRAHYDLSNEFFELMLDESTTYSCALFDRPDATLGEAQMAKIDRLCAKLELGPEDHLVEIGSGWGALAIHAAGRFGCAVTTTTISDAQRARVTARVAEAGLTDRITVLGDDWRDLRGRYSKLVSVEMIEAVDWRRHEAFLAACAGLLADDGLAALQAIVIEDASFERAKRHQDLVRRMIFPGSSLPSVGSLTASLARSTDLRVVDLEDIGRHYAETLRRWAENLERHARDLETLGVGRRFRRLWSLYLAYCEASFLERHVSDVQLLLAKPGWRGQLRPRSL